jgi:short-subunit dehydrogenase
VIPGMRFLGENRGTILFVNGGTALVPKAHLTGTSIAFAGETAYVELLHAELAKEGIHVSQLIIGGSIVAGDEEKDPPKLADILWDLHAKRDRFRVEVATG